MTKKELDESIQALRELADRLGKMAAEVELQRDNMRAKHRPYSVGYNMVLRSIEDAAVTANTMADVSFERAEDLADGPLASA